MKDVADRLQLEAGQALFQAGEAGDCAYLVETGRLAVEIERDGKAVEIARLGPGEVVGEMAIIDGRPRSATVRAVEPSHLAIVTADQLRRRIESADPVVRACLQTVLKRMRDTLGMIGVPKATACKDAGEGAPAFGDSLRELRLERELERGLAANELELHYQPIVELASGRIAGFEALMRWRHPERGPVPPCAFIPAAEASGLIVPMTDWALAEASRSLNAFDLMGCLNRRAVAPARIAVNISAKHLTDPGFVPAMRLAAERPQGAAGRLSLEITESVFVACADEAAVKLKACRDMGFGVSIDDFGAGYSSLSYLSKLPVTALKLDMGFVRDIDRQPANQKIVQCVLGLSRALDLPVVAEGVERDAEAAMLADMGCEQAQGYRFGKPLPSRATLDLIKSWTPYTPAQAMAAAG